MSKMRTAYLNGGFSYSDNALQAMEEGRMTMTAAKKVVAETLRITQLRARFLLEITHDGEWHHVSKYANRVNYYNVRKAIAWGRLLRRYHKLVSRDGRFVTQAIKDSSHRRIIHLFFGQEGINTRSLDVGEWPGGVYPGKRIVISSPAAARCLP